MTSLQPCSLNNLLASLFINNSPAPLFSNNPFVSDYKRRLQIGRFQASHNSTTHSQIGMVSWMEVGVLLPAGLVAVTVNWNISHIPWLSSGNVNHVVVMSHVLQESEIRVPWRMYFWQDLFLLIKQAFIKLLFSTEQVLNYPCVVYLSTCIFHLSIYLYLYYTYI